eukprot:2501321-Alexandrium_andersonii.AAC.1
MRLPGPRRAMSLPGPRRPRPPKARSSRPEARPDCRGQGRPSRPCSPSRPRSPCRPCSSPSP